MPADPIRAITVRQPWAWAIGRRAVTYAGKDIENRTWTTPYRGLLAIHAGFGWDRDGADSDIMWKAWAQYIRTTPDRRYASADLHRGASEFVFGAVIAVADFDRLHGSQACARTGRLAHRHPDGPYECSLWAAGGGTGAGPMYHWELTNVRLLAEPVPCKGRLGVWTLPADADTAVRDQLDAVEVTHG